MLMLTIHSVAIQCCAEVGRIAEVVARKDAALADQLRRAMASVALNLSEGAGSQGKLRNSRYFNALGSAREVGTALEVAQAFGYVGAVDATLLDRLDRIRATLYRILHR
jgi:four helix bundle protein